MTTLEHNPTRVRDGESASKIAIGAIGGALGSILTLGIVIFGAGSWKGGVDVQLRSLSDGLGRLQLQVDRMDGKIDRLGELVEHHK